MKNKLIVTVAALALVMPLMASAQDARGGLGERMRAFFERRPALVEGEVRTSTGTMMREREKEMMDRASAMMKDTKVKYGFGGVISSITGADFILTMRTRDERGNEGVATTTQTVTTSGVTVFRRDGATTTVATLAVGDMAMVRGTLSTSTNIVAATSVDVFSASSTRGSGYESSEGKNVRGFFQSMLSRMKNIFRRD